MEKTPDIERTVADLVMSFLIPEVEKEELRNNGMLNICLYFAK
jgi:hypothetical protein